MSNEFERARPAGYYEPPDEPVEDCPNNGEPFLRWPYFQKLSDREAVYGHCPNCMKPFDVDENVPWHKLEN